MKSLAFLILLTIAVSCKHQASQPEQPCYPHQHLANGVCVDNPVATPTPEPTPEATPKPVVCSENPTVSCGGFKFQGCDMFADAADLIAKAQADKSDAMICLDGKPIYYGDGFGPCMACGHMK